MGLKKDGSTFLAELYGKLLPYKGHTRRVTAVRDITERKKMEHDLLKIKKLEATTILAGGIAHDFNNLLTIITGYADLAQDEIESDSPAREMLHQVLETSRQAKILTEKFLTLSDGYSPAIKTTSIQDLLRAAMVNITQGEQLSSDILLAADLWSIRGDADKIIQALQNIITNAGEAMDGKGLIRVRAENMEVLPEELASVIDQPGLKYIKISIQDSGTGIAPENISRISDPYFSTKQRGSQKGMGLGLTLANAIIKKNNGYIRVESTMEAGTTVTVYLPAAEDLA